MTDEEHHDCAKHVIEAKERNARRTSEWESHYDERSCAEVRAASPPTLTQDALLMRFKRGIEVYAGPYSVSDNEGGSIVGGKR